MQQDIPKQFLHVQNKPVLIYTQRKRIKDTFSLYRSLGNERERSRDSFLNKLFPQNYIFFYYPYHFLEKLR